MVRFRSLLPLVSLLIATTLTVSHTRVQAQDTATDLKEPGKFIFLGLGMSSGRAATPLTPVGEPQGLVPYDSGFVLNLSMDIATGPSLRLFVGMAGNIQRKLVARANGEAGGLWVFEQSGWETHTISFASVEEDTYMFMDAAGLRMGVKLSPPSSGGLVPWVGISAGFYFWAVDFADLARDRSFGRSQGTVGGFTYMAGIDLRVSLASKTNRRRYLVITPFVDLASPVAHPRIEDLFVDGWTWDNIGGNHIMEPYRMGLMVGISL